jgi:DUF1365 family protein
VTGASALYRGEVMHRRSRPKVHRFSYRVFWLLLDLDEVEGLDRRMRLFSRNRFNLLSFHDSDHGDGSAAALRLQIEARLERAGIDIGAGPVRLLTMPRVLGYVFNPISLFYCHHADGRLAALVYEVTNTFGARHAYVVPVPQADQAAGQIAHGAAKALYVSPFMGMEMVYAFRGHVPAERLDLTITGWDAEGLLITAAMSAARQPMEDRDLLAAAIALPLLTLKVVTAIHWQALRLWLKGVKLTRPPTSARETLAAQRGPRENRLGR